MLRILNYGLHKLFILLWTAQYIFPVFIPLFVTSEFQGQLNLRKESGLIDRIQRRQSTGNTTECSSQCDDYFIESQMTRNTTHCFTTFCYTIGSLTNVTQISYFDLLDANFNKAAFSSSNTGWSIDAISFIRYQPIEKVNLYQSYCFNLSGHYISATSDALLNINIYSCRKSVVVPSVSLSCAKDCIVDSNFANGKCDQCEAVCNKDKPLAVGLQTCTLPVLQSPNALGKPCTSIQSRVCSVPCPVDCSYDGPFWKDCPANCATPTTSKTGYYSITLSEQNGGKPCAIPTLTVQECSLPATKVSTECQRNCVVAGVPLQNCLSACSPGILSTAITYSYPITVVSPTLNGSPCPTVTTTCKCTDCLLGPTPTSIGSCEASCTAMDGRAATGLQVFEYPIIQSIPNAQSCTTTSYRSCYKACPCTYTYSSALESCVLTTTNTQVTPWVASGYQRMSAVASVPACNTVVERSCSSTLTPVDCIFSADCPACTCTSNEGPPYSNTQRLPCQQTILRTAALGGKPCPTVNPTATCNILCPGCYYDITLCDCVPSTSSVLLNGTVFVGTKTCLRMPLDSTYSACKTQTLNYPSSFCTVTQTSPICETAWVGCDALCTPTVTSSSTVPYKVEGYRECSYNDPRPLSLRPTPCSGTSTSRIPCSMLLKPIDCTTENICMKATPTCGPTDVLAMTSVVCDRFTLTSARFGGSACPSLDFKTKTYQTSCSPTTRPTPTFCLKEAIYYNVVIYGNATVAHGSVCGRLAVQGYGEFLDYSIGKCINPPLNSCQQSLPYAFIVGKDVKYVGEVMNGNVFVSGKYNTELVTSCDIVSNITLPSISSSSDMVCNITTSPFDFGFNYAVLKQRSIEWQLLSSTVKLTTVRENVLEVVWSGAKVEVINIKVGGVFPIFNSFQNTLASDATIVINVQSEEFLTLSQFNLDYFKPYASKIVWNFYQARRLIINSMTVYGLIALPYGVLSGQGTVYGSAYVLSLDTFTFNASLHFTWVTYTGYCF